MPVVLMPEEANLAIRRGWVTLADQRITQSELNAPAVQSTSDLPFQRKSQLQNSHGGCDDLDDFVSSTDQHKRPRCAEAEVSEGPIATHSLVPMPAQAAASRAPLPPSLFPKPAAAAAAIPGLTPLHTQGGRRRSQRQRQRMCRRRRRWTHRAGWPFRAA